MSRILRRPMFRGGSTSNEGIMSVPRKGYEEGTNEEGIQGEETNTENMYKAFGKIDVKKGSIQDEIYQDYIGRKADPASKFLINFGLNYMSARPRSGKLGFLTTAADAGKAPVKELYEDIDKERLLKLKVMTALSKGESKGAFEKKVNFIWNSEQGKIKAGRPSTFKSKEEVVDYLRKQESETKSQSVEDQVNSLAQKIMEKNEAPNMQVAKNKAYFDLFGIDKISKNEANALANRYFLPPNALTPKSNSTDFTLTDVKNLESTLGKLKEGQTYVDAKKRQVFLYVGQNTFRPLSKF